MAPQGAFSPAGASVFEKRFQKLPNILKHSIRYPNLTNSEFWSFSLTLFHFWQKVGVFTATQALRYISERLKVKKFFSGVKKSPIDDARDILTNTVLVKISFV